MLRRIAPNTSSYNWQWLVARPQSRAKVGFVEFVSNLSAAGAQVPPEGAAAINPSTERSQLSPTPHHRSSVTSPSDFDQIQPSERRVPEKGVVPVAVCCEIFVATAKRAKPNRYPALDHGSKSAWYVLFLVQVACDVIFRPADATSSSFPPFPTTWHAPNM